MYDNVHDTEMRILSTIVRYKGRAVFVKNVYLDQNDELMVRVCAIRLVKGDPANWDISTYDKDLDLSSPPLGYIPCHYERDICWAYAVRMPARRQQQGILPNRIAVYRCGRPDKPIRNMLDMHNIADCIHAAYPTLEEYTDSYRDCNPNMIWPLTRDIAVSVRHLFYRAHKVGEIKRDGNDFTVTITSPSFRYYYFKEVFNENWRFDWA